LSGPAKAGHPVFKALTTNLGVGGYWIIRFRGW
jgi:hypothetical protein